MENILCYIAILIAMQITIQGMPLGKKSVCPEPNIEELTALLSSGFHTLDNNILTGDVLIMDHHFTCLAVRGYRMYQSFSVIVNFTTAGNNETQIVQFESECSDGMYWSNSGGINILSNLFTIPTQTNCFKCQNSKSKSGPESKNIWNETTHCLECSDNCKSIGSGHCVSPSENSCCPYFDSDGLCVSECDKSVSETFHCTCSDYWIGDSCNNCSLQCDNGGKPNMTSCAECLCQDGYRGIQCEEIEPEEINPCDNNPCLNGGTCINLDNGEYTCVCPDGNIGINCDEDIDNCTGNNQCENGGECIYLEDDGSVMCNCSETGFSGPTCEEEIDECSDVCENGGTCIKNEESYECICTEGYSGPNCNITDLCIPNPCLNGGTCVNNRNSYECICPEGYSGPHCNVTNPCIPNPCLNGGTCVINCKDSYECICPEGYSGPHCNITDPCIPNPCLNGGTCVKNRDSYECICAEGYSEPHCNVTDPCLPNPCLNGGTCVINCKDSYECICPEGYSGPHCNITDPCIPNPCLNGGTCVKNRDSYECICSEGYSEPHCNVTDPCLPNPCLNGGTCVADNEIFTCICHSDWTGRTCGVCIAGFDDTDLGDCGPNPTRDSTTNERNNINIGLIIGIMIAALLASSLVAAVLIIMMIAYKKYKRMREDIKTASVNCDTFDGANVMINPVFINPEDLGIKDSMKVQSIDNDTTDNNGYQVLDVNKDKRLSNI